MIPAVLTYVKKILLLVLIIILTALLVFLTKDNIIFKNTFGDFQQRNKSTNTKNYVPGEIIVGFGDDVSYSEVIKAIESENLAYEKTHKAFEPSAIVLIPLDQAQTIAGKLKQNKLVSEVILGTARNELEVRFVFGTSKIDAEEMIKQEGLTMKKFFRFPYIKVKVPQGKEQYYIDKFKKITNC